MSDPHVSPDPHASPSSVKARYPTTGDGSESQPDRASQANDGCSCPDPKFCKNCGEHITNEGYSPPAWWHIGNGSLYCDLTTAEPK